jgi:hypothetical protein
MSDEQNRFGMPVNRHQQRPTALRQQPSAYSDAINKAKSSTELVKMDDGNPLVDTNGEMLREIVREMGNVLITIETKKGRRVSGKTGDMKINGSLLWIRQPTSGAVIVVAMDEIGMMGINSTLGA